MEKIKKASESVSYTHLDVYKRQSQYLDNTNNENLKLNDYFLTDFNAKYTLNLNKTEVDFKFLLNNIFNKKYVNNGYVYEGPIYFSQAGMNFMFGMGLKFR